MLTKEKNTQRKMVVKNQELEKEKILQKTESGNYFINAPTIVQEKSNALKQSTLVAKEETLPMVSTPQLKNSIEELSPMMNLIESSTKQLKRVMDLIIEEKFDEDGGILRVLSHHEVQSVTSCASEIKSMIELKLKIRMAEKMHEGIKI